MTSSTGRYADGLWAITCYFNPMGYRRRLSNFRIFREHLQVPLVAVELAYGCEFELRRRDADILLRLRGGAVLWQKERLLNLTLQALPRSCQKVAWLDCDIIFDIADWVEMADALLDRFAIVQLFRHVHSLSPDWVVGEGRAARVEATRPSAAFCIASGLPAAACIGHLHDTREGTPANGFA
jgi:hypothetical protein